MTKSTSIRRVHSLIAIATLVACAPFSGPARAKDHTVDVTLRISTAGLDLGQPSGAEQLYGRLQHAAIIVCTHGMRVDLEPVAHFTLCYENAIGEAVRSANIPRLTQVYLRTHSPQDAAIRGIDVGRVAVRSH
jgi:UrcA family protein